MEMDQTNKDTLIKELKKLNYTRTIELTNTTLLSWPDVQASQVLKQNNFSHLLGQEDQSYTGSIIPVTLSSLSKPKI